MKKLIILIGLLAVMAACQQEKELSGLAVEQPLEESSAVVNKSSDLLLADENFNAAYINAVAGLKRDKSGILGQLNLKVLKQDNGVLVINSEKEFRPVYESVIHADTTWQNAYGTAVEELINIAGENEEIAESMSGENEISIAVEDLLESDGIGFYEMQSNIAARMPVSTLWAKARNESVSWLADQPFDVNWDENPDNRYAADPYARLFLNEESQLKINGEVQSFIGETSTERSATNSLVGRTQGAGGCRTFWMNTQYTDNEQQIPVCLRARSYVNNFAIWKSYGVNAKGWLWTWGRWRERRFFKLLAQNGNMILHNQQNLPNPCDPAFAQGVAFNRVRNNVEFSISRTIWGSTNYVGACRWNFSAFVTGNGRAITAFMQ